MTVRMINQKRDLTKIIIAGSRSFNNYQYLYDRIKWVLNQENIDLHDVEIVCGMARGADKLGESFAIDHFLQVKYFSAQWDLYGKQAGYIRNKAMAEYADLCICFYDGQSRGTRLMMNLAMEHKIPLYAFNFINNKFFHYTP